MPAWPRLTVRDRRVLGVAGDVCRTPEDEMAKAKAKRPQYEVTRGGIDYAGKRAEPGDVIDDLPGDDIGWLEDQGYIVAHDPTAKASTASDTAAPADLDREPPTHPEGASGDDTRDPETPDTDDEG